LSIVLKTNKRTTYSNISRLRVKENKVQTLRSKWQALSLGAKLFMLSPVAVLLSYRILNDTISVRFFLLIYGSIGVLLYFIFKFYFRKNRSIQFDMWGYPASFLLFASFCALLNYVTLSPEIKIGSVKLDKKSESSLKAGSRSCYIFFVKNKKSQRFTVSRLFWNSIDEGEPIKMYYQESLFGFNIVKAFEK
jgi:hypothetical protein